MAEVVVAFTSVRFVTVEVALFTRMPPVRVARPVAETVPMFERLPEESMRVVPPVWRAVEAFRVEARTVPVAKMSAAERFPEKAAPPWMPSRAESPGVEVPRSQEPEVAVMPPTFERSKPAASTSDVQGVSPPPVASVPHWMKPFESVSKLQFAYPESRRPFWMTEAPSVVVPVMVEEAEDGFTMRLPDI